MSAFTWTDTVCPMYRDCCIYLWDNFLPFEVQYGVCSIYRRQKIEGQLELMELWIYAHEQN